MFLGLKPLEYLYLVVALVITGQQVIIRGGEFDPIAVTAIALFVGLVPAGRADRKKRRDEDETALDAMRSLIQGYLDKTKGPE